jgi:hypothetical protein
MDDGDIKSGTEVVETTYSYTVVARIMSLPHAPISLREGPHIGG